MRVALVSLHCPHWCAPRGSCGNVPLGRVPARVPPWPPMAPGDAVGSSSPWASPDEAETLILTTGVHSHPDLGGAVALPTLGSRLVGSLAWSL